jgi:hypothetical protein
MRAVQRTTPSWTWRVAWTILSQSLYESSRDSCVRTQWVDIEAKNADAETPLHLAAACGHTEALSTPWQLSAAIDARDAGVHAPGVPHARREHAACVHAEVCERVA